MSDAARADTKADTKAVGADVDVGAVDVFLRARLGLDESAGAFSLSRFRSGHSNVTYLAQFAGAAAMTRSYVLRAPPPGAAEIKKGHDVVREARFLVALQPHFPRVPAIHAVVDDANNPLGVPFYVMERVSGAILRKPHDPLTAHIDQGPRAMRALCESFIDTLADLHTVDVETTGLVSLGKPDGYMQRQLDGWRERWEKSKTGEVSDMEVVSAFLAAHAPKPTRAAVVHNDYKLDNLVVDEADIARVRAVLDWEMAAIGEPLMDLGTTLAYWVEAHDPDEARALPLGPTWLPGCFTRDELVARWAERTGLPTHDVLFHYVFACFKVAVIAQQIFFRYERGFTADPRFAALGFVVAVVASRAVQALERGSISPAT